MFIIYTIVYVYAYIHLLNVFMHIYNNIYIYTNTQYDTICIYVFKCVQCTRTRTASSLNSTWPKLPNVVMSGYGERAPNHVCRDYHQVIIIYNHYWHHLCNNDYHHVGISPCKSIISQKCFDSPAVAKYRPMVVTGDLVHQWVDLKSFDPFTSASPGRKCIIRRDH